MDSADYRTKPAGDSRPIRFEALLEHEKELIREANGLLQGTQEDFIRFRSPPPDSRPSDPWAIVDPNRQHRVLMISSPRGSGKTSLMLTLLAGWRAAWTKNWDAIADQDHRNDAEHAFGDMASVVRPLKPLDFDPLPPDLPLYGWIVLAFRPVVQWLMNDGRPARDVGLVRDVDSLTQNRTGLSWPDPPKSLQERLRDLYQTAIVGWGTGKIRDAFQKDLYDLVLDHQDQHLNWQQLQDDWQCFLDCLFTELDRRADVFPKNGLLVLPIDDADLQIERDRELILAIRLLYHPRLVYLLTGWSVNLEDNLNLEFWSRMVKLDSFRDEDLAYQSKDRARNLSSSLRKKVLPSSHVLKMDRLTRDQILDWNRKTSTNLLDKIEIKHGLTLRKFLEQRPKAPDFDFSYLHFRDLQQLQDQYAKATNSSGKLLTDFLDMLINEEDPDEFTVGRREEQQIVLHTYPGLIVPVARVYRTGRPSQHVEVRVGEKLEFYQERITNDLSGDKRLVQASPLTIFALDLAAEAPRKVYVHQHTPRIRPPQCLVWSIWHSEFYETWFPWPSIGARSPTELAKRAEEWGRAIKDLDTYGNTYGDGEWVDGVAFIWIRLHLSWLGESEHKLPDFPESNTAMDEAWSQLNADLSSVDSETRASPWFARELPLLTAPEYGLSEKRQIELIRALHGDVPQMIPQAWRNSRTRAVRGAKRFPRGQEPDDLFEVFTDYQDSSISEEDRVTMILREIEGAETSRNSPWRPGWTPNDVPRKSTRRKT